MNAGGPGDAPDRFATSVPFAALDLAPFAALPPEARAPELFFADELVDAVVDQACAAVAEAAHTAVVAKRRFAADWIAAKLAGAGRPTAPRRWSPQALEEAVAAAASGLGSTFELIDVARRGYPAFLRGEADGNAILLARQSLELWERYFTNANLQYAAINHIAAAAAASACPRGSPGSLRVLEVGGGLGSAAELLLARLGERVADYRFTDVSPWFLAKARARLTALAPQAPLTFQRLDLDRPLVAQGVKANSFDLVHGVNVLHATRDLLASLRELRACLRPGGVLVLGETVRPRPEHLVPMEFVFQLLPQFHDAVLAPERPHAGFGHWRDWAAALERVGFGGVRFVPELEAAIAAYPNYSLAAMVAVA